MRALQCPQCGAKAPAEAAEGRERIVCEFCGTPLEASRERAVAALVTALQRRSPGRPSAGSAGAQAASALVWIFVVVLLLIFGIGGVVVWQVTRAVGNGIAKSTQFVIPKVTFSSDAPLALADLATARFTGREVPLDVAPPIGGLADVDVAVNLPWALTIAQAWRNDVRLDRADVERMRPDGTANCRDDAEAEVLYRFISPSRIDEFLRQSDLTSNAEGEWELWVKIAGGRVTARTLTGRSLPPYVLRPDSGARGKVESAAGTVIRVAPFPSVPSLRQTIAGAARDRRWVVKPFYNAYLMFSDDEGWVWYLRTLSGREDIPRIRARDGRLYPFNR